MRWYNLLNFTIKFPEILIGFVFKKYTMSTRYFFIFSYVYNETDVLTVYVLYRNRIEEMSGVT